MMMARLRLKVVDRKHYFKVGLCQVTELCLKSNPFVNKRLVITLYFMLRRLYLIHTLSTSSRG